MRDFRKRRGQLRTLDATARALHSIFLLFVLTGLAVASLLYGDGPTLEPAAAARYYAGGSLPAAPAAGGDIALDLPPELAVTPIEPMNRRRLMEVTHGHLFVMPLIWLTVAHLFALAGFGLRLTQAAVFGGAASVALHIAAPWLIRAVDGAGWLMPVSGIGLLLTLGGMAVATLVELWRLPNSGETQGA
jgi:hypothetical protein